MNLHCIILGASGFGGVELLRLLSQHPLRPKLMAISSKHGDKDIAEAMPSLLPLTGQSFVAEIDWTSLAGADRIVLFAALPHGEFAKRFLGLKQQAEQHQVLNRLIIIDLSGDFRLSREEDFSKAYGGAHPCPQALADFQYGLCEWTVGALRPLVANPGCFATALILAMAPLGQLEAKLRPKHIAISAITGSSGSGATPGEGTHHPLRAHDFRAYKALKHQHVFEVRECLKSIGAELEFSLVTHSAPLVRGIYATLQWQVDESTHADALLSCYQQSYRDSAFVRVRHQPPQLMHVIGSNRAEIAVESEGRQVAVMVAIDNLVKGMAGQAVQNMNRRLEIPEISGLEHIPLWPG